MNNLIDTSWIVLLPTIIVLGVSLLTRRVLLALFIGIVTAALITTHGSIFHTITLVIQRIFEQTEIRDIIYQTGSYDKLYLFGFLILLSILTELFTHTGGMQVYAQKLIKKLKNAKQAQFFLLFSSFFFFLDDYLNCLMLGSIMRPVMDYFKLPRIKLAYLLNSTHVLKPHAPQSQFISELERSAPISTNTGPFPLL